MHVGTYSKMYMYVSIDVYIHVAQNVLLILGNVKSYYGLPITVKLTCKNNQQSWEISKLQYKLDVIFKAELNIDC